MWFLDFIPTAWLQLAIHGVVAVGILLSLVGAFASRITVIAQYGIFAKVLGSILLIAGVYFEGGYGVEMTYRLKTEELQSKLDAAEKKSDDLKNQLGEKVKTRTIVITQKVTENAKDIEKNRESINSGCNINDNAWLLYNRAVAPKLPDSTK